MFPNSLKHFFSSAILVAVVAGFVFSPPVSRAVTVGPVKLEYKVDPGETLRGELFLQNEGSVTQTLYPSFERFTEDSSGQKNFTKEESDLSTWFKIISSVTLKSGEGRQIPFTIQVPKNAPPGGHFAVIWWSSSPPGGNSKQVSIITRAGILVYLTVSGNVNEAGSLKEFYPSTRFFTSFPLNFSILLENSGNTYLKPVGILKVKNLFGGTAMEGPVNEFGSNVFPQISKGFSVILNPEKGFFFGPYRAVLELNYGDPQQTVTKNVWFLILPWGTLIGFIILLFLIFFAVPRGIKKYNAWIISKARK